MTIKMKKPRTCYNCRIFDYDKMDCLKCYPTETTYDKDFNIINIKPTVPCPKPLTIRQEIDSPYYNNTVQFITKKRGN